MSNILIIKHGSLGDLVQANGAMEDIKKSNPKSHVVLLTSLHYFDLMNKCPYVDEVLIDKRFPRWNLLSTQVVCSTSQAVTGCELGSRCFNRSSNAWTRVRIWSSKMPTDRSARPFDWDSPG